MLEIQSRNDDGIRITSTFETPEAFIHDMNENDDCLGDNEILLVTLEGSILYSSMGNKAKSYEDTLRTMDVYDWFLPNLTS